MVERTYEPSDRREEGTSCPFVPGSSLMPDGLGALG